MIDREVSLSASELDDALDKEEAGVKLNEVVDILNETQSNVEDPFIVKVAQMSKEQRIKKLVQLRRIQFQRDATAQGVLEESARREFQQMYTSEVGGTVRVDSDLLKKTIYCLSENVLDLQRYK